MMKAPRKGYRLPGRHSGFTLIEVLIAILVLAFGLLGFALLQTMNVRFVQSANHRTQATNLGYELLDQIRANRMASVAYAGGYTGTTAATGCGQGLNGQITPLQYRTNWSCRLGRALGAGATANVVIANDNVTVDITWADSRWEQDASKRNSTFRLESVL